MCSISTLTRELMASSDINLTRQKYFFHGDDVVQGKQGKGVHIMKTNQPVLVGVYYDPKLAPGAATMSETLGYYLKSYGFQIDDHLVLDLTNQSCIYFYSYDLYFIQETLIIKKMIMMQVKSLR